MKREGKCVLQYMGKDSYNLIEPLGRNTGTSVDKGSLCAQLNHPLVPFSSISASSPPPPGYEAYTVLPNCAAYVPLETLQYIPLAEKGEADHDVVILRPAAEPTMVHEHVMTTGELRELEII
ncbi:hypothetical protein TrRE_jg11526 [Triparma retinervis]|uniref:Uncharacterized protein n=1 Tax=Triparma retinervis TaxID=2557542 RepID=A0A9W7E6G7_9STRA|nr:hypothetical protein TrRE_jg11526 [Triparma retinervis]